MLICVIVSVSIFSLQRHRHYRLPPGTATEQAEKRLLYIPALFLLLRVWGTTQFFYSIGVTHYKKDPVCISIGIHTGFMILGVLQVGMYSNFLRQKLWEMMWLYKNEHIGLRSETKVATFKGLLIVFTHILRR